MKRIIHGAIAALGALALITGAAAAQGKAKVSIAVGGAGCLCYLPTVLAKQLGEFDKAGVEVELINRPNERPLGSGEGAQGPAVAAVANAFANATGKRARDLPLDPSRVKAVLA